MDSCATAAIVDIHHHEYFALKCQIYVQKNALIPLELNEKRQKVPNKSSVTSVTEQKREKKLEQRTKICSFDENKS